MKRIREQDNAWNLDNDYGRVNEWSDSIQARKLHVCLHTYRTV